MPRKLTSRSSLESLRREAKRWLRSLRAGDPTARSRFVESHPAPPSEPSLRAVQHALAREFGLTSWAALRAELVRSSALPASAARAEAAQALLAAAGEGDVKRIVDLLDTFPDIVNERAGNGARTALHRAVFGSSESAVRLLLARGADPNIRDNDPRIHAGDGDNATPLHFAAEKGEMGIVRLLVEHGADTVGDDSAHELNVLGWATCFESVHHAEVAAYLLAHGARHTIHTAVAMADVGAIRELAARIPADLDRPMDGTNRHRRPLHLAVVKQRPESLAALLELGADPETTDAAGLTPLDTAALRGERAMAERLIEHGARIRLPAAVALGRQDDLDRLLRDDPHALRPGGRWERLIIQASATGTPEVVEALLRAGASVHVRDDPRTAIDGTHGCTALHAAAASGKLDNARVLLRYGADPRVREERYSGTPAGWANYFGHEEVRDAILEGPIDIFDAIEFDRLDRFDEILARDPLALNRPIGEHLTGEREPEAWPDGNWTPIAYAVAGGKAGAVRELLARGADLSIRDREGRTLVDLARNAEIAELLRNTSPSGEVVSDKRATRVAGFLRAACLDWRVGGREREHRMYDAGRMLERDRWLARADLYTAVACGELEEVMRILAERPEAAVQPGGPHSWPPLLYLCAGRLPGTKWHETAPALAELLLDHGADPNAFYLGGNADIHYTALTCVLGRGEELASMHPRARELTRILLERGANPHDGQVLYNIFADNTSRHLLDEEIVWLLELLHEHSVRRGHQATWDDPEWPMFDMRGAPSLGHQDRRHPGAHLMLSAAIDRDLLGLAEWLLRHGAGPNTPPGNLWRYPDRTLHQEALVRGHEEMAELLVRYGATRTPLSREPIHELVAAGLTGDDERVRRMVREHPAFARDPRPLLAAAERNRPELVELLIELGADPNAGDREHRGKRALHVAAAAGSIAAAKVLLSHDAEVDPRDAVYDSTPLGWASYFDQREMVEFLGRASRDVWTLTYTGNVQRLREVLHEEPELARSTGKEGQTPLMWLPADSATAHEIARMLLENGADPSQRDAGGRSAADIADARGMEDVAALLRGWG